MRRLWTVVCVGLLVACGSKSESSDDDELGSEDGGGVGGDGSSGTGSGADGGSGTDDGSDGGETGDGDGGDWGEDDGEDDGSDGGDWGEDDGGDGIEPTPVAPEIAPVEVPCGGELSHQAFAVDPSGVCVEGCDGGTMWFAGVIYNPCEEVALLSLMDGMVISSVSATNVDSGEGFGSAGGGTGTVVELELGPGEYVVDTEYLGSLSRGSWEAQLNFNDGSGERVEFDFTVE
jgi:hypothetical protein